MRFRLKYGTVNMEVKIDLNVTLQPVKRIIQAQTVICGETISALGSGESIKEASDAAIKSLGSAIEHFIKKKQEQKETSTEKQATTKYKVRLMSVKSNKLQAAKALRNWRKFFYPNGDSLGTCSLERAVTNIEEGGTIQKDLPYDKANNLYNTLLSAGVESSVEIDN